MAEIFKRNRRKEGKKKGRKKGGTEEGKEGGKEGGEEGGRNKKERNDLCCSRYFLSKEQCEKGEPDMKVYGIFGILQGL